MQDMVGHFRIRTLSLYRRTSHSLAMPYPVLQVARQTILDRLLPLIESLHRMLWDLEVPTTNVLPPRPVLLILQVGPLSGRSPIEANRQGVQDHDRNVSTVNEHLTS